MITYNLSQLSIHKITRYRKQTNYKEDLIDLVPPPELGLNLVPKNIIQQSRIKQDPSPRSN